MVRTRIAPSPTGNLHIGTARTALLNYLYAKSQKGTFILRIEDTDKARSTEEFEGDILEGLEWLGLHADEGVTTQGDQGDFGPYRQSERTAKYRSYLELLIQDSKAYYCECTPEQLYAQRQEAEKNKKAYIYNGTCRNKQLLAQDSFVIRFKTPIETVVIYDLVRDKIEFQSELIGDFVIAKNLDNPLYNFVVVIDDELMQISHIIRGEDHISNTPKQVLINQALGFSNKKFAHLPLILATDRSKMSKRFGATAVSHYREQGYLPEALINFLALMGWSDGTNREDFSLDELIKKFSLKRIQKSGAIFNQDKLDSINAKYIKNLSLEQKMKLGQEFLGKNGFDISHFSEKIVQQIILLECDRIKKFSEIGLEIGFLFEHPVYDPNLLLWKENDTKSTANSLERLYDLLYTIDTADFNTASLESLVKQYIKEHTLDTGSLLWPLRVSLSGLQKSPTPFEIAAIIGKKETLYRINQSIGFLKS